jgi:hypothetical protein
LLANLRLIGRARFYLLTLAAQLLVLLSPWLPGSSNRLVRVVRYYTLVTASIALGTLDRFRDGPPAAWEKSEGTR